MGRQAPPSGRFPLSHRVLIVSPHFPPVNAPDMQRIRLALPYFLAAGWDVTVLTVDDPTPAAPVEPDLLRSVPAAVQVVRARCLSRRWTKPFGIGNVALRALPFLFATGLRLLNRQRYDVVYFSTTMFSVLPFGRLWRALTGVPYVIDLQDPWVTDYYSRPASPPPPGGWKYGVSRRLGLWLEGWTLARAAHIVAVSEEYPAVLRQRYPGLPADRFTVLPFGSPDGDLADLRRDLANRAPVLPPGGFRLAFAGALGPGMLGCVEALVAAVAELRREGLDVSAHFYGTSYAGAGRARAAVAELVGKYRLQDAVLENPERLRFFDALQVTLEAEVNLLFGSTDLGFTPSKVLALLAAKRPILAIAHAGSALANRLAELGQPCVLLAGARPATSEIAAVAAQLRTIHAGTIAAVTPPPALGAEAMAAKQLALLAAAAERAA